MENENITLETLERKIERIWSGFDRIQALIDANSKDSKERFVESEKRFQETEKRFQETEKMIQETGIRFQETDKKFQETEKYIKEISEQIGGTKNLFKDTDKELKETGKYIKEISKQIGGIGNSNGDFAESLMINILEKKLSLNGMKFNSSTSNLNRFDKKLDIREQYDLILEKEDLIAIVEIKYKLRIEDLHEIYDRKLPNFRKLFPYYNDKKIIAVAAALSAEPDVLNDAKQLGIYVITLSGKHIKVLSADYKEFQ